ncbi:MAG: hypothetical protein R2748_04685 [Bryobacterales bacterium]
MDGAQYSPAKLFGLVGVGFAGIAAAIGMGLVIARSQGVTTLDPLATFTLFAALVLAVCGVSIYSLGVTFNFLVSLFHGHPMSRGLFGDSKLEQFFEARFGWMGLAGIVVGAGLGATPLLVGGAGWDMARSWLWFLGGAAFTIVGFQLLTCWIWRAPSRSWPFARPTSRRTSRASRSRWPGKRTTTWSSNLGLNGPATHKERIQNYE